MTYTLPSAVPLPNRPAFPGAPLKIVPDLYAGTILPDDFFYARNACDLCDTGLETTYPMAVTLTIYGEIETFCVACFTHKYVRPPLHCGSHRSLDGYQPFFRDNLAYVCVLTDYNRYDRWVNPAWVLPERRSG